MPRRQAVIDVAFPVLFALATWLPILAIEAHWQYCKRTAKHRSQ